MMHRLSAWLRKTPSRRRQALAFRWNRLLTAVLHRPRLLGCGPGTIVGRPLFWTPEHIHLGREVLIWPGCRIEGIPPSESGLDHAPLVWLGDSVTLQQSCHITAAGRLSIGSGTLISFNVSIQDTDHLYEDVTQSVALQPLSFRPTVIGENCFIGAGARILAGTVLGRHCVVAANAVVRGEFPDYCVIAGSPGRVVKQFDAASGRWMKPPMSPKPLDRPDASEPGLSSRPTTQDFSATPPIKTL